MIATLGRKQSLTRDNWQNVADNIDQVVPRAELDTLIDRTLDHLLDYSRGKHIAYGWSAGKDSITLRWLIEQAGLEWPSFITFTETLEYPAFVDWANRHAPDGLQTITAPLNHTWLRDNPHMLFPQDSKTNNKWMQRVQRWGWTQYNHQHQPDAIALGKRTHDGNIVGPKGSNVSTNRQGVTTWSPIADWRHEHLVALITYEGLELPAIYDHPRGFEVGTGPWAQRTGTHPDPQHPNYGWAEVYTIDPTIVHQAAAEHIPGAHHYLKEHTHE